MSKQRSHLDALARQALELQRQGNASLAEVLWRQLLQADPKHPQALAMLGLISASRGDLATALDVMARSLRYDPHNLSTEFNLALVQQQAGRPLEALSGFERVLARRPGDFRVLDKMGMALHQLHRYEAAVDCYSQVLQSTPHNAEVLSRKGKSLYEGGRYVEAADVFRQALAIAPDSAETQMNLGVAQHALNQHQDALASLERALASDAEQPDILLNFANVLAALDRYEEAIPIYRRLLNHQPDDGDVLMNLANALRDLQRYDEALPFYERAMVVEGAPAGVRWNRGLCRLAAGDLKRGFSDYEVRFNERRLQNSAPDLETPRWSGSESLAGKTLLVYAEQGLGDTLQFCRYASLVSVLGGRVVLEVQPALLGILKSLAGVDLLVGRGEPVPPHDFNCPLASLPLALGTTFQTIPASAPYLQPDDALVARFTEVVTARPAPRIGVAWSGNPDHPENHRRSIDLSRLMASLPQWASVWSLVPRDSSVDEYDKAAAEDRAVLHHFEETRFVHTAAQMAALDLVVTVDTSIAHLAGALGAKTWLLLPYVADWRWFSSRTDSPWYPTVRVFRQPSPGDWADVLSKLRQALTETFGMRGEAVPQVSK
ncbi:tetratricopeptide repeat protein [Variovorax sp. CCNWLW235]|uniref:tetratricopeptide repeat protein n=1 Tax=Variovorax sp. CCNWLW235 TaxID=3127463 RepID=UPI003076DCE4